MFCIVFVAGFFSTLFDSTYPTRLNGIISQDEFEKSINNINGKIAPNRMLDCTIIIAMSCTIAGIVLVVIGLESTDSGGIDPEMAMGGFGLFFLGLLFCLIVYCINSYAYIAKMEKAVNEESMKYRSRSPISSNWRIIDARYGTPIVGHFRNNKTIYTVNECFFLLHIYYKVLMIILLDRDRN